MEKKRVVITGLGILASEVKGKEELWNKVKSKQQDFRIIEEKIDGSTLYRYGGCVDNIEVSNVTPIVLKQTDIAIQYALYTAMMALKDSKINLDESTLNTMGMFFGSELGGLSYAEREYRNYINKGYRYLSPYLTIAHFFSAPIGQLSILLKIKGFSKTYCCGECSSSIAIGEAYKIIRDELAKVVISGGFDKANTETSGLIYSTYKSLAYGESENSIPKSVPYDPNSGGMILSDGSGMVILEEYEFAKSRDAHIYAEIKAFQQGFSINSDKDIIKNILYNTLKEAEIKPQDIKYIHGSGLGIPEWDKLELSVIKEVFGNEVMFGCPASNFGNTLASVGSLQLISTILSMENNEYQTYDKDEAVLLENKTDIYSLIFTRSLDGNISALIIKNS